MDRYSADVPENNYRLLKLREIILENKVYYQFIFSRPLLQEFFVQQIRSVYEDNLAVEISRSQVFWRVMLNVIMLIGYYFQDVAVRLNVSFATMALAFTEPHGPVGISSMDRVLESVVYQLGMLVS